MMSSLFKWEMKQTLSSKSFWFLGASLVLLPGLFLMLTLLFTEGYTGYNAFLEGLNNYNAFVIFLIGVFAGIHVTGSFDGRKIQSAVMAGNSRFNILITKFLSYSVSVAMFGLVSIIVSTAIAFSMQGTDGMDGSFARVIIGRSIVYIIVETAYSATCFLASMFIRHLGGAIGVNLGLMLMSNIVTQLLFNFEWAEKLLRFTAVGQSMLVIGDFSNNNIMMALAASVIAFAAVIALSYVKFSKEELK